MKKTLKNVLAGAVIFFAPLTGVFADASSSKTLTLKANTILSSVVTLKAASAVLIGLESLTDQYLGDLRHEESNFCSVAKSLNIICEFSFGDEQEHSRWKITYLSLRENGRGIIKSIEMLNVPDDINIRD